MTTHSLHEVAGHSGPKTLSLRADWIVGGAVFAAFAVLVAVSYHSYMSTNATSSDVRAVLSAKTKACREVGRHEIRHTILERREPLTRKDLSALTDDEIQCRAIIDQMAAVTA